MKIGILGSGTVAQQLGKGLIQQGYEVKLGTRDISKLEEWSSEEGDKASVGSFQDAAKFGEILFIATLWKGTLSAIEMAGVENFDGKVVVDVTNPLDFSAGTPPTLDVTFPNSAGLTLQNKLPNAKMVKAFNTISAFIMIQPKLEEGTADLFIAGNDEDAKKTVGEIARKWGWGSVNDMGDISASYWLEAFAMFWIRFGFQHNHWSHAFKLLRK